jgi:hypothetical protein
VFAVSLTALLAPSPVSADVPAVNAASLDEAPRFASPAAIELNARRAVLEKKILAHLTGADVSTFEKLKLELEVIRGDLSAKVAADKLSPGILPPAEGALLAQLLLRDERMLTGGAALARGASTLDPRIEKILRATADKDMRAAAASVDAVVGQLLSVSTSRDPAALNALFDNLRASLNADPAASANLDAVKADIGAKALIVYTQPSDPLYSLTNAAKRSRATVIPPAESDAAPVSAPAEPVLSKEDQAAAQNCEEALNGAMLSVGKVCKYSPWGAAALAGVLDAVHQQLLTVDGLLLNAGFMLLGLVLAATTGGVALIFKILLAIGMTAWAIYSLVPAFTKVIKELWDSKDGSIERYAAIRQLASLLGSVVIMGLLALLGGAAGKKWGPAMEAKVSALKAKIPPNKMTGGVTAMMAKLNTPAEAKFAAPKMEGASHAPKVAGDAPASAVHSVDKGYVMVAEESRAGGNAAAPKTGAASRVAQKAVTEYLERELKAGEPVPVEKAHTILAAAMEKADLAVRDHAVQNPAEAGSVDLSVAIVAKDAAGGSVLVSAKAGDAGVFLRRDGALVRQRPAPPVLERFAAVKKALTADGLTASEKITPAQLKGASNVAELAKSDPVLQRMLAESETRTRRFEARAKADPALAKAFDEGGSGFDLMEYKARVADEPMTGEVLGFGVQRAAPAQGFVRPSPAVLERFAAVEKALAADGLSTKKPLTVSQLKGAKNLMKLAETEPALQRTLLEALARARRLAIRAKGDPALAESFGDASSGIDWLAYKARVSAEPMQGGMLSLVLRAKATAEPVPLIERWAKVKRALAADGLSATDRITAAELKDAKNVAKLADYDPALRKILVDAQARARRLAIRAKGDPALAKSFEDASSGIDWMEYKARAAAETVPGKSLIASQPRAPQMRERVAPYEAQIQEIPLKPGDVVFAASRSAADIAPGAHELVPKATPSAKYVRSLLDTERMRVVENERAVAELTIPEKPGFLTRAASRLADREIFYRANVLAALSGRVEPSPLPQKVDVNVPPVVPTVDPDEHPHTKPDPVVSGGGPGPLDEKKVVDDDDVTPDPSKDSKINAGNNLPTPKGGRNSTAAAPPAGKGGAPGGGGPSGKHPKAPSSPGGFGDKGGAGGMGGGGTSASGGGVNPDGKRGSGASDISAAAPSGARPASFAAPAGSSPRSLPPPSAGAIASGHSPSPSLAARFDGSRERPRNGSGVVDVSMKGLGAGDHGGLPHLTPHEMFPKAPKTPADELKETDAASAAMRGVSPAAPAAAKPEDEDYRYTYLAPARHKYELPEDPPAGSRDWRTLAELGLQGSAALAVVYLSMHSENIGYILGVRQRPKKTDQTDVVS